MKPSPIIEMTKAVALGYANSFHAGLEALRKIKGLEQNHLYSTALGDFYFEVENKEEAKRCCENALLLTRSNTDKQLLVQKISNCFN